MTKTNFFTAINPILEAGLTITISVKRESDKIIVSVRPQRPDLKDAIDNKVTPLVMTHTPEDLDANFFETITAPMAKVDEVAAFIENLEKVKADAKKDLDKVEGKKEAKKKEEAKPVKKEEAKPVTKKEEAKKSDPTEKIVTDIESYCEGAEINFKAGKESRGYEELKKAQVELIKLGDAHKDYAGLLGMVAKIEREQLERKAKALDDECEALHKQAEAKIKALNFPEGVKLMFKVLATNPNYAPAIKLREDLVERLGETTIVQLSKI